MPFDTGSVNDPHTFAAANGLQYDPVAGHPPLGGALFEFLSATTVTDRFRSTSGRELEIGSIRGTVGGGQKRQEGAWTVTTSYSTTTVRSYGYMAMQLDRALPHIVLDARSNGSSIPMPIGGGQKLSLEGDFDRHFRLYCPRGYETDALYIMTPDLMALLVDETGDFDVEIVDDMLYVYATTPFDVRDPALWERLGRIRDVVGAKALRQTDFYTDDRVGDRAANVVGDGGRRLRMGFLGGGTKKMLILFVAVFGVVFLFIGGVAFFILSRMADLVSTIP